MIEKVKVVITNDQREVKIPTGVRMLVRRCCTAILVNENFNGSAEVSVRFVNDEEIQRLNLKYRQIDKSTDVLSFPLGIEGVYDVNNDTGAQLLGDIVISVEHAVEQAARFGHSLQREIGYLTVHSMLHLLGYDHESGGLDLVRMREKEESRPRNARSVRQLDLVRMREKEEEALTQLGLKRNGSYYMADEI